MAVISVHRQQICGFSWSPSGDLFATGSNDNLCCLFETGKITTRWDRATREIQRLANTNPNAAERPAAPRLVPQAMDVKPGDAKQRWLHNAAVKAIAFCPWQDGLVATGGGSNDQCIHFFHTCSGRRSRRSRCRRK